MAKFVKCDCGVTVRNDDDDALVAEVQQHVVEVHWTEVERDDILEMIEQDAE
jgi:predicted small metal-binding protein